VPGLTKATHLEKLPLPLPIRTSRGFFVSIFEGKTLKKKNFFFRINFRIKRRIDVNSFIEIRPKDEDTSLIEFLLFLIIDQL
jgi:hypothetical protein